VKNTKARGGPYMVFTAAWHPSPAISAAPPAATVPTGDEKTPKAVSTRTKLTGEHRHPARVDVLSRLPDA
jgi:hypothetical protein